MRSGTAYGALSAVMKDNLYWLGSCGFIFTSPWVVTPKTVRHAAVVLLTASGEPVEVTAGETVCRPHTVTVWPLAPRRVRPEDLCPVSNPLFSPHPGFLALLTFPAPGVPAPPCARLG